MERFSNFIQRLRGYPEALRRQIFWFSVVGCVLGIGALWLFTLPWQLKTFQQNDVAQAEQAQPTLSETLGQGGAAVGDIAKSALRDWLLGGGNNSVDNTSILEPEEEASFPQEENLPRLPRAE